MFLWQASFFPTSVQGSDNASDNPNNGAVKIVVQRGESLWSLALKHQTTVVEIVKLNKVKSPDHIREGESLWVPKRVVKEESVKSVKPEEPVKPEKTGDIMVSDNTFNPSWWLNALRRRFVQKESTIITYEIFVNPVTPVTPVIPDPPLIITLPLDAIQKQAVVKTASIGAEKQNVSRSLGQLISKEDIELLSRVIHGEARGEGFEGQVAVGAVVLNRVKDPRFPKTIRAVIYQSGAFTAVDDKQIHLEPNDQAYKAAEAALSGLDPSNGALFYFNPHLATDRWIKTRPVVKQIGNHTFSI